MWQEAQRPAGRQARRQAGVNTAYGFVNPKWLSILTAHTHARTGFELCDSWTRFLVAGHIVCEQQLAAHCEWFCELVLNGNRISHYGTASL